MSTDIQPLITIITVSFNAAETIEKTILSVINQTYKNIEYIIIDGGSSDGTVDIASKYRTHITYFVTEEDEGISDAFNKGIKQANGDLIGIINADDWYEYDACEAIVSAYNKNFDVYYGNCNVCNENGDIISKTSDFNKLRFRMSIYHPSCFITKRAYEICGLYSKKYKLTMDYDLLIRMMKQNLQFKHVDKIVANFKLGGVSNSNKKLGLIETLEIKNNNSLNSKMINRLHFSVQLIRLRLFSLSQLFKSND